VLPHRRLDPLEVGVARALAFGELEVVVEAVGDRRPDRDLRLGPQLDHRGRHHVRGVVADQPERVIGLGALALVGHDRDLRPVGQRRAQVAKLAVDLDPERVGGEARADRGRRVGAGGARLELERAAVGEFHGQLRHRRDATQRVGSHLATVRA
jgi:hypothetical protein